MSAAYVQYMASRRQVTSSTEHAAPSAAGRVAGAKKYEGCKCKRKAEACSTGRVALERQVCTCGVPGTARPMVSQATQAPHVQTEHAPLQSTINSLVVLSYYTLLIAHGHKTAPNNPGTYLSLIHISEPTRPERISYAVFCLKKKNRIFDK